MKPRTRKLVWIAIAALAAVALFRAFRPAPVVVDVAVVRRGPLVVTVADDGRTRVRERYTIHAPFRGRLLRSLLDPGDLLRAGETVVAEFEPAWPELLDERTRSTAEARLDSARAAVDERAARLLQAEAESEYATAELRRIRELLERGIESLDALEAAERDARARAEAVHAARSALRVAEFEVEVAAAALREPSPPSTEPEERPERILRLRSPIDGRVLRLFEESARPLEAGAALVEVGDPRSIEVVADYLSQDAVKVAAGMPASISGFGGQDAAGNELVLQARVRVVEPSGYTKISALGVEEQRVDIVLDPDGDAAAWAALGDGFRVDVHIEIARADDVLLVPTGALFRDGDAQAVYVIDAGGRAEVRQVTIGRRTGLEAEVQDGLAGGERVILYPSALIEAGTLVEARA